MNNDVYLSELRIIEEMANEIGLELKEYSGNTIKFHDTDLILTFRLMDTKGKMWLYQVYRRIGHFVYTLTYLLETSNRTDVLRCIKNDICQRCHNHIS